MRLLRSASEYRVRCGGLRASLDLEIERFCSRRWQSDANVIKRPLDEPVLGGGRNSFFAIERLTSKKMTLRGQFWGGLKIVTVTAIGGASNSILGVCVSLRALVVRSLSASVRFIGVCRSLRLGGR